MGEAKRNEMMTARQVKEKLSSIERKYIELTKHLQQVFENLNGIQKNDILEEMKRLINHRKTLLSINRNARKTRRISLGGVRGQERENR